MEQPAVIVPALPVAVVAYPLTFVALGVALLMEESGIGAMRGEGRDCATAPQSADANQ
jgi:hypothetical protein